MWSGGPWMRRGSRIVDRGVPCTGPSDPSRVDRNGTEAPRLPPSVPLFVLDRGRGGGEVVVRRSDAQAAHRGKARDPSRPGVSEPAGGEVRELHDAGREEIAGGGDLLPGHGDHRGAGEPRGREDL